MVAANVVEDRRQICVTTQTFRAFVGSRKILTADGRYEGVVSLWITCLTELRDWRHPLDTPHRWTPLFFLDDGVALAAGHRPCATCRTDAYRSYRDALTTALGRDHRVRALEINARLNTERLRRGRGMVRAADRLLWTALSDELPGVGDRWRLR